MTPTQWVLVGIVVILITFDLLTYLRKGDDSTISRTLLLWSKAYPVIAFVIGFAMGHIFWSNCG